MTFASPHCLLAIPFVACTLALCGVTAVGAVPFAIENVDVQSSQDLGAYASLALDSNNNPHIAYQDVSFQDLKYAHKVGGVWVIETVDSGNLTGAYASLALDANDAPHIAYYNAEAGLLRYAEKTTGTWMTETVPDTGIYGSWCSIAVDSQGRPLIAYRHDTDDDLSIKRKSGTWGSLGGSGNPGDGFHTSIAIGPNDFRYVSHYTSPNLALAWAAENFTAIQTIDSGGDVGEYNSIAIAPDGAIHISYHDELNGALKYATNMGPSTWDRVTVDDGGGDDVGEWTSIALDDSGEPHITYFNATKETMLYAFHSGGSWTIEDVDRSKHNHGQYSSLALDTQGNPHVAYYDIDDQGLAYASGGIRVTSPNGGESWAVGSTQNIHWFGAGQVDVFLSTNGSDFEHQIASSVFESPVQLRVPHLPSRFARVQVRRSSPFVTSESDSLFTIDASVIVSNLKAILRGKAVVLTWESSPGPDAGIGYRVRRSVDAGLPIDLHTGLLRVSEFVDDEAPVGAQYRVSAVNGLGEETILGDVRALPEFAAGRLLRVTPNPLRTGDALVMFRSFPGVQVQLQVYDVRGALVRTIYSGRPGEETAWVRWDGTDNRGTRANAGVYFVRLNSPAGLNSTERLILLR